MEKCLILASTQYLIIKKMRLKMTENLSLRWFIL